MPLHTFKRNLKSLVSSRVCLLELGTQCFCKEMGVIECSYRRGMVGGGM